MLRPLLCLFCGLLAVPVSAAPNWTRLYWTHGDLSVWRTQRLMMSVEAEVGEMRCQMQLDTGMNGAVDWQHPDQGEAQTEQINVAVAGASWGIAVSPATLARLRGPEGCSTGGKMGNIGTGFFGLGTLTVDMAQDRLGYEAGSQLGKVADTQPLTYASAGGWGGFPLVEIRQGDKLLGLALFDTGSAAIGLSLLNKADWQQALASHTGRRRAKVRHFTVPSWGKQLDASAAEIDSPWQAGTMPLGKLRITYIPDLAFQPPVKLIGVLGLQSLGKAVVTLDIVGGRWQVAR
ncbi:hypothetical protein [Chitinimonas naiadis]